MAFFIGMHDDRALNVAIVGFGTVGRAVARILCEAEHPRLRWSHVCNRNVARKHVDWAPADVVWTERFDDVLGPEVDVVVELIGGVDPAAAWIRRALDAGKAVVTANKQVIAHHGADLLPHAAACGRPVGFEAAVAGGIPVLHGLRCGLAGDTLYRVLGILNGTCNYVLTRMGAAGVTFDEALAEAQRLGFAEADPSADVDGLDAQAKLAILSAVGLGRRLTPGDIPLQTIRTVEAIDFSYARRLGCAIRQVAQASLAADGPGVVASVQPTLVPTSSTLARVEGSQNVVVVEGCYGGETSFAGHGAGGDPTAAAVVSDLEAIAAGPTVGVPPGFARASAPVVPTFVAPHYLRFVVEDRPGIIAAIAEVLARHAINLDAVLQEPGWDKHELPFVVTLNACASSTVAAALTEIAAFDFNVRPPLWMPMLAAGDPRR